MGLFCDLLLSGLVFKLEVKGIRALVLNLPNAVTFNMVLQIVVTPPPATLEFLLLLHDCSFANAMNHNLNT